MSLPRINEDKKDRPALVKQTDHEGRRLSTFHVPSFTELKKLPSLTRQRQTAEVTESKKRVSDLEDDYPPPFPPKNRKEDIFKLDDFKEIDDRATKVPDKAAATYDGLLDHLLKDLDTDLKKIRVLFRWLVTQKFVLPTNSTQEKETGSPLQDFKQIQQKRFSYQELFALLCRKAGMKCAIIQGVAKGVGYEPGDKIDMKKMKNKWNAVFVDRNWRLIHPYWAAHSATGYSTGRWSIVESDSWHTDKNEERTSPKPLALNEFYFLTDPDKFIYKCFPLEQRWQLLVEPITKQQFEDFPYIQPNFHELGLSLKSPEKCVMQSERGKAEVRIEMPKTSRKRLKFGYKMYKNCHTEDEGEYDQLHLDRHLLHYKENTLAVFEMRFPLVGDYKLELHCSHPDKKPFCDWVCDFKVTCTTPMKNCFPLPLVPAIGWGPGEETESAGFVPISNHSGVVSMDDNYITEIKFKLTRGTEFKKELLHYSKPKKLISECVSEEVVGNDVLFRIKPPGEGEYAFRLLARDMVNGRNGFKNICNYLLQRTTHVEDPKHASLREELIKVTDNEDYKTLQLLLDRAERIGMEDRGDLTRAKAKFSYMKVNTEMSEAIKCKDLDQLEKLLTLVNETQTRQEWGHLIDEAEDTRNRLRRLKRLRHEVLEMDSKTISEIRSYAKPPMVVHGVMAATFLLLGNKEQELKRWPKIQALISKRGKDALKRRVANFTGSLVTPQILKRTSEILDKYDAESVQIASAGASTFYNWVSIMVSEIEEERKKELKKT